LSIKPIHNETEILSKISAGDARAFTCLFDFYYKNLGQYVYRLTESLEATEEIVQDVFVKIWSGRESLSEIESFTNYLFIITRNKTYRFLKDKAAARTNQQRFEQQYQEECSFQHETSTKRDFSYMIDELIGKLPPQQRKVYKLSKINHLKYSEIATLLSISPETVKKHVVAANKFIKNSISENNDQLFLLFFMVCVHFLK
jgi:RNA polymerase sigma-70 factor (ECF subfamily)